MSWKNLLVKFRYLFNDMEWICAYRPCVENIVEAKGKLKNFKIMSTCEGTWAADPFLINRDGKTFCFFEYTNIKRNKSALAMKQIEPTEEGEEHVIFEFLGHCSYPNIFEWNGDYYIIPETKNDRKIVLLKNTKWPYEWEQISILEENVLAVDSTPLVMNGKLYLLIYEEEGKRIWTSIAELDVKNARILNKKLLKEYTQNIARPGGHFIYDKGRILQVRQPGIHFYGERLDIVELKFDDEMQLERERVVNSILPNQIDINLQWRIIGIHTYNRTNETEIIDLFVQRFNLLKPFKYVLHKLRIGGYGEDERDEKFVWK